ncbi:twin-arginine translocase TatA/TatE family subunit [Flavobacterium kingsejongi]|uniref:Sec-independent protein translocase protein TatA n=1 Tax=Flavobacterium kingsejongi TaxID=1678728 RepID=A0A2S1LLD9_9FLAO|nr:twin-arginine translocase TatA/TatE family subunit [Flavobacterium kingsejongi]AWG24555.1 twin-arginine translocase TatA/TatE family subunit [Flavobacterium kingsejongi]
MTALNVFLGIIGGSEWILIAIVILLLFGGKKIPELMKGLGNGMKEFKNATKEDTPPTSAHSQNKDENKL